jgi:hypothetical protein
MSYMWHFYSFSTEKFSQVFGAATPEQQGELIDAVLWEISEFEEDEFEDSELTISLTLKILKEGINYEGISIKEAEVLDEIIGLAFSPEGLNRELEAEPESPDGLHPSIIKEMMKRAEKSLKLKYLPILLTGQRIGQPAGRSNCNYFILEPTGINDFLAEVKMILKIEDDWSDDYVPQLIDECLLFVLEQISKKQKAMIGFLG